MLVGTRTVYERGVTMKRLGIRLVLLLAVFSVLLCPIAYPSALAISDTRGATLSIKQFKAMGDGRADDTDAIEQAFNQIAHSGGGCLHFPAGIYRTTRQLTWNIAVPLCIVGDSHFTTVIYYEGNGTVDSTLLVGRPSGFASLSIANISFAANANAKFSFHGIQVGSGSMDNVAFSGGNVSAFEGDFWNCQKNLNNLMVEPGAIDDVPYFCQNGLTFANGALNGTSRAFPSTQFTLTSPTVMNCRGTGLNIRSGQLISIINGQISNNDQNLYDRCDGYGCNAPGNTFTNLLLEKEREDDAVYNRSVFIGLMISGEDTLDTYSSVTFIGSQLTSVRIMKGTREPLAINSFIGKVADASVNGIKGMHNFNISSPGSEQTESMSFYADGMKGPPVVSGCGIRSKAGGAVAGSFKSGTSGRCTVTIVPGTSSANGFRCSGSNLTEPDHRMSQIASTKASCTLSGITTVGDLITWDNIAF